MKKILAATILIAGISIGIGILHYRYGMFTELNYFTAKADIKKGDIKLFYWGEPDNSLNETITDYHFYYSSLGCTIDMATMNGARTYNHVMMDHLTKLNGEGWFEKFNQEVDSLKKASNLIQRAYTVTAKQNKKDSSFILFSVEPEEQYSTELWVSDPECTECKDCFVDSGEVKIPEMLKPYVTQWNKDLLLTGNNPYAIEQEAYIRYKLKGQVVGVKNGYPVFEVHEWKRR